MLDYNLPQLARYWNNLVPKETYSKKGKTRKRNQNAFPSTRNDSTVDNVPEQPSSQEDVEESGSQADNGLQSDQPQNVSRDSTYDTIVQPKRVTLKIKLPTTNKSSEKTINAAERRSQQSPKCRKRNRKKSYKHQCPEHLPRKKSKIIRPPNAYEDFAEAKIHAMTEQHPHQGDDYGMEDEAAEGLIYVPVRNHSADAFFL